ncbi:hypothetical protein ASD44_01900 [Mesorhizobium sp. Root554]|uniref:DUF3168 domain-containing protein n=1 Tax=unclassified Mesorhizobium TaxID=325217 RepID=UPI00070192E9|nr:MULTISPECIES: DUF3168 domain-containing protein [unclassified Mesorhizobium]KQZ12958.1 hypothetical protein ASD27_01905 [Mesorhizobium sp. Root1471]KQZ35477.1 hypothetical protein ASD44_01900 [Mesorhizobium sp. Root554]
MTSAAADLQKALFSALSEDAALSGLIGENKVFDHAPADIAFPYLTFGRTSVFDWSTGTDSGTEQLFTLHIWSKAKGKKETLEIMNVVQNTLQQEPLTLDSHRLVNLRFEFAEARYDEDLSVHHGLLRFRAITEEAG